MYEYYLIIYCFMLPGISPKTPERAAVDVLEQVAVYIYINLYIPIYIVCVNMYVYVSTVFVIYIGLTRSISVRT